MNNQREERRKREAKYEIYLKIRSFMHYIVTHNEITEENYKEFIKTVTEADIILAVDLVEWIEDLKNLVDHYYDYQKWIRKETGTNMKVFDFCQQYLNEKEDKHETLIVSIPDMQVDKEALLECYQRLEQIFFSYTE